MSKMRIFQTLQGLNSEKAHIMLRGISMKNLEKLYFESVEYKKKWPKARQHISDELNLRTSEHIEEIDMEHCAALDQQENVAAKKEE